MTRDEITEIANQAAQKAVEGVLIRLGIETDDAKEAKEMRADFIHLRRWRQTTEAVQRQGFLTVTIALMSGLIGLVVLAFWGRH